MIPQADLAAAYAGDAPAINAAITRVMASGRYILGPEVEAFEREFAAYCQASHAVGVANGTDALVLALKAVGVKPGTSVITVSHTVSATVAAVELAGAVPVLADVGADGCMDPDDMAGVLRRPGDLPPIAAILPVHLYGRPADMTRILRVAAHHRVPVVDDCAHAPGAAIDGLRVGSLATASAFSFYPTKNLGGFGDGGMVTTNVALVADRVRSLRQYGWREDRYVSLDAGGTDSRLDELQAAILRERLPQLDARNERRRQIGRRYKRLLRPGMGLIDRKGHESVAHLFVVRVPERDRFIAHLGEWDVSTNIHYPVPVHRQPAYEGRVPLAPAGCVETERLAAECVTLPLYPEMSDAQVDQVCAALRAWEG